MNGRVASCNLVIITLISHFSPLRILSLSISLNSTATINPLLRVIYISDIIHMLTENEHIRGRVWTT